MKYLILLIAVACTLSSLASAAVLDLDESNFDSSIGDKAAFVEFFAPWCGHCKKLAPEYEQVGETFAKFGSKVVVAKVDCDSHRELCQRFDVSGYPTLKFFAAKSKLDADAAQAYTGARNAGGISEFIADRVGIRLPKPQSAVTSLTPDNFDSAALDSSKFALTAFTAPWCGHCKSLKPIYELLAKAFASEESVVIANVDADAHSSLGSRYGVSGFPTIKFFGADNEAVDYSGGRDLDSLVAFINEQAGTSRGTDGRLDESAGRVDALDAIAAAFVAAGASDDDAKRVALGAIAASEHAGTFGGKVYARAIAKIASDGVSYIQAESDRLNRIIESDSITGAKVDQFTKRINILQAFVSA
jgi:protein disulfide-isomerase A6